MVINLLLNECLYKNEPYLKNIIIGLQISDAWKIQLTNAINFISSKDAEEEHVMHSTNNNVEFKHYSDANEVIDELFESLRSRHQGN